MPTLTDALTFITGEADAADLDRVLDAVKTRRKIIGAMRAATVGTGDTVTLAGLSPKVLNGLTGVTLRINGARTDVELDSVGTQRLSFSNTRFADSARMCLRDGKGYTVRGVPLSCCEVQE